MAVPGFRRLPRFLRSYDFPQEALGPVFVMRTRVSCGQGIGWRERAARRPARRSWRCHDSEPCDSRMAFHYPEHVLDLGADFPEPTVASALRYRQWASGLRFSLYGPQNARCFRLLLLPVVGITLVAVHRTIILTDQILHHLGVMHAARGHAHDMYEPTLSIDADVCLHAKVPLVALLR